MPGWSITNTAGNLEHDLSWLVFILLHYSYKFCLFSWELETSLIMYHLDLVRDSKLVL